MSGFTPILHRQDSATLPLKGNFGRLRLIDWSGKRQTVRAGKPPSRGLGVNIWRLMMSCDYKVYRTLLYNADFNWPTLFLFSPASAGGWMMKPSHRLQPKFLLVSSSFGRRCRVLPPSETLTMRIFHPAHDPQIQHLTSEICLFNPYGLI